MVATALRAIMARTNDYLVRKFLFDVNNVDICVLRTLFYVPIKLEIKTFKSENVKQFFV